MKILIVDDVATNRKLLRVTLEAAGHAVIDVEDGVVALARLEREKVEAVITDILMPRMDGYRLCREIRARPALHRLPIIAYTSTYLSEQDEQLALRSGADCYLRKPAPAGVLLELLTGLAGPGASPRPAQSAVDEPQVRVEYNAALVRKLEDKSAALSERNGALQAANEQLRALAARNEKIREHERTTIAREIHDVLAQELTRLKIDLLWLAKRAASPIDETIRPAVGARITETIAQVDTAITTVQRIATELRPVILDSLGLPAAIEWQVEDFARRTGLTCHAETPRDSSVVFERDCATALFRILQEALTNVARHAEASRVDVRLEVQPEAFLLTIADDGRGITTEQVADPHSIGLVGMRERALAMGGTVEFGGLRDRGTTVHVRIPQET